MNIITNLYLRCAFLIAITSAAMSCAAQGNIDLASLPSGLGFRIDGETQSSSAGWSVASAGHFNNDSYDDLIIGANGTDHNGPGSGCCYVLYGKASGFVNTNLDGLTTAPGFRIDGVAGTRLGTSVASAGDINNDGYDDLIVGAYEADFNGRSGSGSAYVIYGGASSFSNFTLDDLPTTAGFRIDGAAADDDFGYNVASAGDVNNDTYDDVIVGAQRADFPGRDDCGTAYVIFGKPTFAGNIDVSNMLTTVGFRMVGAFEDAYAGYAVASAGDLDNDNFDDILVGSIYDFGSDGAVFVVFGNSTFPATIDLFNDVWDNPTVGITIQGQSGSNLGRSVSTAGDFNNDGIDDMLLGGCYAENNSRSVSGSTYVLFGKTTGWEDTFLSETVPAPAAGFRMDGALPNSFCGYSASPAGDLNHDNRDDILVGCWLQDFEGRPTAGASYVVYGKSMGIADIDFASMAPADGFHIGGAAEGDHAGFSVASAGDFNGDTFNDILIGAPISGANGTHQSGSTYVLFAGGLPTPVALSHFTAE
jgi:hypothetical protein